jgi:hypothetical protein
VVPVEVEKGLFASCPHDSKASIIWELFSVKKLDIAQDAVDHCYYSASARGGCHEPGICFRAGSRRKVHHISARYQGSGM